MQRVFTKDTGKNFRRGDVRDYPMTVWREIARSAKGELDTFTTPLMAAGQAEMIHQPLLDGKKK